MTTVTPSLPYFDLTVQYRTLREEIREAVDRVSNSGAFVLGEEVREFERAFADYCGVKHCVALNSGTSALHLALIAAGVRPGDEVIIPANTFIATAEAICYTGARPVFADIDPATANLDPEKILERIKKKTRAIIPVHLYGRPVALEPISEIAYDNGLVIIEDACQAHGARYRGRRVGSLGQSAAFSFYPGKNLGAYGEGGALTTNDDGVAHLARCLRSHGETTRYVHEHVGYNYRMDGWQAAVLNVKLKYLDAWISKRRELSALYRDLLGNACVALPRENPECECVYHLLAVFVNERDQVRAALANAGVQTLVHYPIPLHRQKAFEHLESPALPNAERACARALSMPLFPEMTAEQVNYACTSLTRIVGEREWHSPDRAVVAKTC